MGTSVFAARHRAAAVRTFKSVPIIRRDSDSLSSADELTLYHHYKLNYTQTDTATGRRLSRRQRRR